MEVTVIGWLLLIVGPALMIARPRWLYALTIFSLPFTGTEVANVGSGLDASGVQVAMFLGSLLLLRHAVGRLWRLRVWLPKQNQTPIIWLASFVTVTGLSLAMPTWINGRVQVPSPHLTDPTSSPLFFHSGNFTGFLYMVYGFAFAYFIAEMVQRPRTLHLTIKSFLAGSVFAGIWALMEFTCKISGIPYPAMIFNNGTGLSTLGYMSAFLTAGIPRLSSVTIEPANFAEILLVALALYLPTVVEKPRLFGKVLDRLFFILMAVVLLLTSSSTAYIGIFVLLLLLFSIYGMRGIVTPKNAASILIAAGAAASLYASLPIVRTGMDAILFSKSEGGSAVERLMTVNNAYQMFLKYPLLGIGWGSVTSHDLIFNILGNAGLLGLLTFTFAMYSILRPLYFSIKLRKRSSGLARLMQMDLGVYIALCVTLATSVISGFPGVFSFFWFVVGLALSGSALSELGEEDSEVRLYEPNFEGGARNPSISPRPC